MRSCPKALTHVFHTAACIALLASAATAAPKANPAPLKITAPPEAIVKALGLKPFYKKYVSAGGVTIISSEKVNDYALLEAAYLVNQMLGDRPDIRKAIIESRTRLVVMGIGEFTTDVPEHSDLKPSGFWDKRARGLGATPHRPATSCGEENLLRYPGDPYHAENILIHEFAHVMHHMGLDRIDKAFDKKLNAAYKAAMAKGLWKGKYASNNRAEYWAEAVQSWFDTNRPPDHDHNHVDTRDELKAYDPAVAKLVAEVFGDKPWRYTRPSQRKTPAHLAGYDRAKAPRFTWPERVMKAWNEDQARKKIAAEKKKTATPPAK